MASLGVRAVLGSKTSNTKGYREPEPDAEALPLSDNEVLVDHVAVGGGVTEALTLAVKRAVAVAVGDADDVGGGVMEMVVVTLRRSVRVDVAAWVSVGYVVTVTESDGRLVDIVTVMVALLAQRDRLKPKPHIGCPIRSAC